MTIIRNRDTKKEYPVSNDDWEMMKKAGKTKVFEVVRVIEERPLRTVPKGEAPKPRIPETVERVMSNKGPDAGPSDQTATN